VTLDNNATLTAEPMSAPPLKDAGELKAMAEEIACSLGQFVVWKDEANWDASIFDAGAVKLILRAAEELERQLGRLADAETKAVGG
jgi:hypothetical protein